MKTLTKLAGACLLIVVSVCSYAQDIEITGLTSNPVINKKWNELKAKDLLRPISVIDTIPLDSFILEDFSYPGPYPDSKLWLDKYVFVNQTFAYAPPSIGVATFDGLNEQGYPYDFTASESSSEGADTLTSKPIDLNVPASDSIYFSFSYQPQGLGNSPASKDSLILEFKGPGTGWNNVWSKAGSALNFKDTVNWSTVKIVITDPIYLKKGFQFRFRNYATISGSFDHWHIDYIYLINNQKYLKDFRDYTFIYNHPSLIKNYRVVPFRQYIQSDAKAMIAVPVRNNSKTAENIGFAYSIKDETGTTVFNVPVNSKNVDPYSKIGYFIDTIESITPFPLLTKPTSFYVEVFQKITKDIKSENDTLRYEQKFGNYFAYDDGTAESAFSLKKANSYFAMKFGLNVQDTLNYVDIYFNPKLVDASKLTFNLMVWGDANGEPGSEIATSRVQTPDYSKKGVNNTLRYGFDAPVILPPGTYYVGIFQPGNVPVNIGLDMNTNSQFNTFYKSGLDAWNTMPYPGTAILRPVFGTDTIPVVNISTVPATANLVDIYPNPATSNLMVRSKDLGVHLLTYTIIDVSGREIETKKISTPFSIDISKLENGIYFIRLQEAELSATLKFIKTE